MTEQSKVSASLPAAERLVPVKHQFGHRHVAALNAHRVVVRRAVAASGGFEVTTQGDAFFVVFPTADAAVAVQRGLLATGSPVRVRIGIHTGAPARNEDGHVGLDLHQGARICASGHGGQVVLPPTTRALATRLPDAVRARCSRPA